MPYLEEGVLHEAEEVKAWVAVNLSSMAGSVTGFERRVAGEGAAAEAGAGGEGATAAKTQGTQEEGLWAPYPGDKRQGMTVIPAD